MDMQQRLNFRPLPHGQGWLRPGWAAAGFGAAGGASDGAGDFAGRRPWAAGAALRRPAGGACGWGGGGGGRFCGRAALGGERGFEAHGGGGLRIGQDGLDCAERLGGERPGLLAPSEVLVAPDLDEGLAKSGGAQPIADGVAVDADELSGGGSGGAGGQQSESALLGGGQVVGAWHEWEPPNFQGSTEER